MGNRAICAESWCFQRGAMQCTCNNQIYCSECLAKHMMNLPDVSHNATSLSMNSSRSLYSDPKSKIVLKRLRYRTPEGNTEVYDGYINQQLYAVKIQYCRTFEDLNKKQEEAALQRSLKHKNICKCVRSYLDESYTLGYKFVIVMEYGIRDLDNEIIARINEKNPWSEEELMRHINELIDSLAFMQENNLAHRDIKPANILLFPNDILKLADFGLSIQGEDILNTQDYKIVGTVAYLSPALKQGFMDIWEGKNSTGVVRHNPYKSDVFSLGLSFLHMASLMPPISLNSCHDGIFELQQKIRKAIKNLKYSKEVKIILEAMLEVEEERRMDFLSLREWINSLEPIEEEDTLVDSPKFQFIPQSESKTFEDPREELNDYIEIYTMPAEIKSLFQEVLSGNLPEKVTIEMALTPINTENMCKALQYIPKLKILELNNCLLGEHGIRHLTHRLSELTYLEVLSLGNNNIQSEGTRLLCDSLIHLKALKILRLWNNSLKCVGAMHLSLGLTYLVQLEELYLAENEIKVEGARYLSKNLPNSLKILSMPDNMIEDVGARFLSGTIKHMSNLKQLYLDNNRIGSMGAKYLATNIPSSLVCLRLNRNFISAEIMPIFKELTPKLKVQFW